jgi:hypothetical protein
MPDAFAAVVEHLASKLIECLSATFKKQAQDNRQLVVETLKAMYTGEEVEVLPPTDVNQHEMFKSPIPLATFTGLKEKTAEAIKKADWDTILCVAESGEWLLKEECQIALRERPGLKLAAIVADKAYLGEAQIKLKEFLAYPIAWLPWWLHNQHLTLFLQKRKPRCGFYFERRLRALHIAPLYLTDEQDSTILLDTFVAYWIKADNVANQKHVIITRRDLESKKEEFLNGLYGVSGAKPAVV